MGSFLLDLFTMLKELCQRHYQNLLRFFFGQVKTNVARVSLENPELLYKSEGFLVVNKGYDEKIKCEDLKPHNNGVCVENKIRKQFPEFADTMRFAHRLDYATSGALCVATSAGSARWAAKAFERRHVTKHYLALVRGQVSEEAVGGIVLDKALGRDTRLSHLERTVMCTADNEFCRKPRASVTHLYLLEHGTYEGQPVSKLLLVPQTGRTHQLRVHCLDYGHLIVGDYTYSNGQEGASLRRMMLHAYRLIIPMKREQIDVTAPDPFLPEVDPSWRPFKVFSTYEDFLREHPVDYFTNLPQNNGRSLDKYGKKYRHLEGRGDAWTEERVGQGASVR